MRLDKDVRSHAGGAVELYFGAGVGGADVLDRERDVGILGVPELNYLLVVVVVVEPELERGTLLRHDFGVAAVRRRHIAAIGGVCRGRLGGRGRGSAAGGKREQHHCGEQQRKSFLDLFHVLLPFLFEFIRSADLPIAASKALNLGQKIAMPSIFENFCGHCVKLDGSISDFLREIYHSRGL